MKEIATRLKNNLSEQLKYYQDIDKLSLEKKELIIKGDAEALSELDKRIESAACQVLDLEQKRLKLLEAHLSKNSRLSDFIKKLDPELARPLNDLRNQLLSVMQSIQRLNDVNVYLIENSIKWIEYSINTIANVLSPESSAYNANGKALTTLPYSNRSNSSLIEHEA